MHIFHKWSKWVGYQIEYFGNRNGKKIIVAVEKRQKRKCLICNKEQDEKIAFIF